MAVTAKKFDRRLGQRGALELLEEAFHLLRQAPWPVLTCYLVGTMPLVLALLFFMADMSCSAYAHSRLVTYSLVLAILYIWMRCWQSVFCSQLWRIRGGILDQGKPWTWRRVLRLVVLHAGISPWNLLLGPLAAITVLPLPVVYGFFQNVACLALAGERAGDKDADPVGRRLGGLIGESVKMATLWLDQSMRCLLVMAPLGLVILGNFAIILFMLPQLLRMFAGIETDFSRAGMGMANSTFFTVVLALTYLLIDPLMKALFVLRCFYGRSLASGEDLRADLAACRSQNRAIGVVASAVGAAVVLLALAAPAHAGGQGDGAAVAPRAMVAAGLPDANADAGDPAAASPGKLDEAIRKTIRRPEYSWRTPREMVPADQETKSIGFLSDLGDTLNRWGDGVSNWVKGWFKPKSKTSSQRSAPKPSGGTGWSPGGGSGTVFGGILKAIAWVLIIGLIGALAWLIAKAVRNRNKQDKVDEGDIDAAPVAAPDISDDNATADQLPEEGWLDMAGELIAKGQLRLALRAMYLACLANLAARDFLRVARFKSNREYQGELMRRSHALPELMDPFGQNMLMFEDAWYGMHDVNMHLVEKFRHNQRQIAHALAGNVAHVRQAGQQLQAAQSQVAP